VAYSAGTINSSFGNSGQQMLTAIEEALTAHPAWEFVEGVTVSFAWRVWRCSGAQNMSGEDFHIALTYGSGVLMVKVFEGWNTNGKLAQKIVPNDSGVVPSGDGSYASAGVTLEASGLSTILTPQVNLSTSVATNWNIHVSKSRLFASAWHTGGTPTQWTMSALLVGLATPRAGYPKCLFGARSGMIFETYQSPTSGYSAASRGVNGVAASHRIGIYPASPAREGMVRAGANIPDPISGDIVGVPVIIVGPESMSYNAYVPGTMGWRATLDDVLFFNEPWYTYVSDMRPPGDIAEIGGVSYVKFGTPTGVGGGLWVRMDSDI